MMGGAESVSLIVCTRNRAKFLGPFLSSLQQLTINGGVPFEIVFVDNGSTDDTCEILKDFCKAASFSASVVTLVKPGLARARNFGVKNSKGDILIFTDDDCYPEPSFIHEICKAFSSPDVGYAGGRVELYDPQDLPLTIKLDREPVVFRSGTFIGPGALHGANMAFRRVVLDGINGFDELLGSGTPFPCEDCDALHRASQLGAVGVYRPEAVVSHHHRRRGDADRISIETAYTAGRGAFYVKLLVFEPRKMRTAFHWFRSLRFFGFNLFPKELGSGLAYLRARRQCSSE
jgi:glycosyltransferase involved in cell wall biosynthesis